MMLKMCNLHTYAASDCVQPDWHNEQPAWLADACHTLLPVVKHAESMSHVKYGYLQTIHGNAVGKSSASTLIPQADASYISFLAYNSPCRGRVVLWRLRNLR